MKLHTLALAVMVAFAGTTAFAQAPSPKDQVKEDKAQVKQDKALKEFVEAAKAE